MYCCKYCVSLSLHSVYIILSALKETCKIGTARKMTELYGIELILLMLHSLVFHFTAALTNMWKQNGYGCLAHVCGSSCDLLCLLLRCTFCSSFIIQPIVFIHVDSRVASRTIPFLRLPLYCLNVIHVC